MQKFDAQILSQNLNTLAEVFERKPVTPKALEAWFDTLKEFPTERIMSVLIGWPKSHGKFPTPAEVWKTCNELGIAEREKRALQDARVEIAWERSPRGAEFLGQMKRIINRPRKAPVDHWRHVLETHSEGSIGYEYAQLALKRKVVVEDEDQSVNF